MLPGFLFDETQSAGIIAALDFTPLNAPHAI
jgi:hypothetical protein